MTIFIKRSRFTIYFLYSISSIASIYAQHPLNDSTATITIHAKNYKNKKFQFFLPSKLKPSVTLDSNGFGAAIIQLKEPLFVSVETNDSAFFNFLIEPGYDLNYTINKGITKIEGIGSAPNNYLLKARVLLDSVWSATDKRSERTKKPSEFMEVMRSFEQQFKEFHRHYTDSISFSVPINYILKSRMQSTLLLIKQRFIASMDQNEIDSLDLENKLGLVNNDIFKDTLLMRSGHIDFWNFLMLSGDQALYKVYTKYPENTIFPLLFFSEVYKSNTYSEPIKEYLLYNFIDFQLTNNGITPILENLSEVFYKIYPTSYYTEFIKKNIQKFKTLTYGNPAPDFTGRTITGEMISLHNFKGKLLLIDVWATWCGPCKAELPYTQKILETFKENKDFSVLYVSIDSDVNKWTAYLNKNNQLSGTHINIDDKAFDTSYKITGVPRYMLIDKKGNIIEAFEEHPSKGHLEAKIKKLLANERQ